MLLKCTSCYPADPKLMNLATIPDMAKKFKVPVGLSDHTLGIGAAIAACAMGARAVEKHFILSRRLKTADSFFSIEPTELKTMVGSIRIAEAAVGRIDYRLTSAEKKNKVYRRSLFAVSDIERGDIFTPKNVSSIRPSYGLSPKWFGKIIGRSAKVRISKGTPLKHGHVVF